MLIHDPLFHHANKQPDKTALVFGENTYTYWKVAENIRYLSAFLRLHGLKRGERVVIYLPNCPEVVFSVYAVSHADGIFSVVHPDTKIEKLAYIVNNCEANMLITSQAVFGGRDAANEFKRECPWIKQVLYTDELRYEYLSNSGITASHLYDSASGNINIDLATIIYTSGSTGFPKGVTMNHLNVMIAVQSIIAYLKNTANDRILNVLPLSFDYGLYQVFMCFTFGGTLILQKDFGFIYETVKTIEKHKITGFPIVPTILAMLFNLKDPGKFDFSSLRYISNTGATLPVSYIRAFRELYPLVDIFSMYGLTECKRVAYLDPRLIDSIPDSVGKAMPDTEVFIVDDAGIMVGPNETGTLMIRGASVMQGYWNDHEATAQKIKQGKYPHDRILDSGDLFRMDDEGYLYFVGRKDDLLKIKGERVAPREIEMVIQSIKGVEDVAVVGIPDDIWGAVIKAYIVQSPQYNGLSDKEVISYCKERLEPFAVPKEVVFLEKLPRNSNGKIDKFKLGV